MCAGKAVGGMVRLTAEGVYLLPDGTFAPAAKAGMQLPQNLSLETAREKTMAAGILAAHNSGEGDALQLRFDAAVSPDNNYVSILQTVRAVGLESFPIPYVLTNCHNTLCAVGGTINEDDHTLGLGCAQKYGGIFVPPYRAVIHQYMREAFAGGGKMILGSDSHTRYGALGTMGIGEGGGEVAKQLLGRPYTLNRPQVVAVALTGKPKPGVGPQDVALALIGATFQSGFVKNKVLEFVGGGIQNLSVEYRMGIDVMTTESAALSSIWATDEKVREYLALHGREGEYKQLAPQPYAYYDALVEIDLGKIESMVALPFHPSNVYSVHELLANGPDILAAVEKEGQEIAGNTAFTLLDKWKGGALHVQQALVSGCAGGLFENIAAMADILEGATLPGNGVGLGINPASQPVNLALMQSGIAARLTMAGATLRPCICGPCFGVTDVPANNTLSIRHVTRNYPNRDGSKPNAGQMAAAAILDARSIAATVRNSGRLTAATDIAVTYKEYGYSYDTAVYQKQVYNGFGKPQPEVELQLGPNIADWPPVPQMPQHLLLVTTGVYDTPVTTDELVPSGEASSYRSNPHKLAEYTMSGRDAAYVKWCKTVQNAAMPQAVIDLALQLGIQPEAIGTGGLLAAPVIGDGSSREHAASCQKVLGGWANLATAYATKRYQSNLVNWGLVPLLCEKLPPLVAGDKLLVPNIQAAIQNGWREVKAYMFTGAVQAQEIVLGLPALALEEREALLAGSLINSYRH